jgi:hypothetical protein
MSIPASKMLSVLLKLRIVSAVTPASLLLARCLRLLLVRKSYGSRKQYKSTDCEEVDKLHIPARARLALRFLGRNSFGDTEGHLDSTWMIVNVHFDVAVHAEPDFSTAELDSGAKTDRALSGIAHVAGVDVVVGQLLPSEGPAAIT